MRRLDPRNRLFNDLGQLGKPLLEIEGEPDNSTRKPCRREKQSGNHERSNDAEHRVDDDENERYNQEHGKVGNRDGQHRKYQPKLREIR